MSIELLFLLLAPLIIFVVVELRYGAVAGVGSALGLAVALLVYWYLRFGQVDQLLLAEFVLVAILGVISLKMKDSRFFKFQPVAVGAVMVAYFGFLQLNGESILERIVDLSAAAIPQLAQLASNPRFSDCAAESSLTLIAIIAGHAVLCGLAAIKLGSIGWLVVRVLGYPLIMVASFQLSVCLRA